MVSTKEELSTPTRVTRSSTRQSTVEIRPGIAPKAVVAPKSDSRSLRSGGGSGQKLAKKATSSTPTTPTPKRMTRSATKLLRLSGAGELSVASNSDKKAGAVKDKDDDGKSSSEDSESEDDEEDDDDDVDHPYLSDDDGSGSGGKEDFFKTPKQTSTKPYNKKTGADYSKNGLAPYHYMSPDKLREIADDLPHNILFLVHLRKSIQPSREALATRYKDARWPEHAKRIWYFPLNDLDKLLAEIAETFVITKKDIVSFKVKAKAYYGRPAYEGTVDANDPDAWLKLTSHLRAPVDYFSMGSASVVYLWPILK